MEIKHYIVEAKCGHVGINNFIIKSFTTKAFSAREAARKARWFGRVKHHWKDAIVSVRECSEAEYEAQFEANRNDPFFHAKSIQEQRATCEGLLAIQSILVDEPVRDRRETRGYRRRKHKEMEREAHRMIWEYQHAVAYAN
jgi:hypothetical protein